MINRIFGSRTGNIIYGVIGLLAGFAFLFLNLSNPDTTSTGDWVWCIVGFVAGAFLLGYALLKQK
jgi:uncharacterized membrane protein YccC